MDADSGKKHKRDFIQGFLLTCVPTLALYSAYLAGWRVTDNKLVIYLCFLGWVAGARIIFFLTLIIGLELAFYRRTWMAWIGTLLGMAVSLVLLISHGGWEN